MTARHPLVLIVDDEAPLTRTLQLRLGALGYQAATAGCAREALAFAAEHAVDLVLLDVNLPDMSGYQVARQLRRLYAPWTLPILMLTVNRRPIDQLRGFAHGADAYLTKPFNAAELCGAVARLIGAPATV